MSQTDCFLIETDWTHIKQLEGTSLGGEKV